MNKVEECYEFPYKIFQKYFPKGTIEEFDEAFVSFDVSKEEFIQLKNNEENYICLETVIFDLNKISNYDYEKIKRLKSEFRK